MTAESNSSHWPSMKPGQLDKNSKKDCFRTVLINNNTMAKSSKVYFFPFIYFQARQFDPNRTDGWAWNVLRHTCATLRLARKTNHRIPVLLSVWTSRRRSQTDPGSPWKGMLSRSLNIICWSCKKSTVTYQIAILLISMRVVARGGNVKYETAVESSCLAAR